MLDFSFIDPVTNQAGDQTFSLLFGTTAPGAMAAGTLYYDSTNGVLYAYVGNQGVNVAPSLTIRVGTGITWDRITADFNLAL